MQMIQYILYYVYSIPGNIPATQCPAHLNYVHFFVLVFLH